MSIWYNFFMSKFIINKLDIMKQSQSSNGGQQSQSQGKAHTENKDNLDSRHKEEETVKGDKITNNQKQHSSLGKKND